MPEQHPFTTNRWFENLINPSLYEKWINNINSFGYMPNKETRSIFLGTFPIWQISTGNKNQENFEFFYGSSVNEFWNCLGEILEFEVNTLENRLNILEINNIGITDILKQIDRNPINSNLDRDLTALSYNNIIDLKCQFSKIENIFITSGGKSRIGNLNDNNKNVGTWLKNSVIDRNLKGFNQVGFVKEILIDNIKFNLIYLYSPSNSTRRSIQGILNRNNNFDIENIDINSFRRLQWGYFLRKYHLGETNIKSIENIWDLVNNNETLLDFFEN